MVNRIMLNLYIFALFFIINTSSYALNTRILNEESVCCIEKAPTGMRLLEWKNPSEEVNSRRVSDLDHALIEHTRLVMPYLRFMRQLFIEDVASPSFFAVCYRGLPTNVFIFPTLHSLPLEIIPPYIRKTIELIAGTPHSQLYCEIVGEDDESKESDDEELTVKDPRAKLDVERTIQRELDIYTKNYSSIYLKDSDLLSFILWQKEKHRFELEIREAFSKGWAESLSPETKAILLKESSGILDYWSKIEPTYVYEMIHRSVIDEETPLNLGLDSIIMSLFYRYEREVKPLETEEVREEARKEEVLSKSIDEGGKFFPLSTILFLINTNVGRLESACKIEEDISPHVPTIDEVIISDPMIHKYLMGLPCLDVTSVSVKERNEIWWEDTICPLLEERSSHISRASMEPIPPVLLIYGAAHNLGSSSILKQIEKLGGFQLQRLTRHGFVKHKNF